MMKKEKSPRIRNQMVKLSLSARLTITVGIIVFLSLVTSYGLSQILHWLLPASDGVPLIVQLSVFSLVVALIATRLLSRIFFSPIQRVNEGMKKIADGQFDTRIVSTSTSLEVQEMFAGFNMMARELASTEILQSDFVSNVSHEFKTPISAIEGYSTLLQGGDNLDKDQCMYVEKILFNTQRLSNLVSNILLLSKIENQAIPATRAPYGLDEQVRESILAMETAWTAKGMELDVDLDDIEYNGNEKMMQHVWNNLIDNAIKFSPNGGCIRIRLLDQKKRYVFTVEDNGPGLSDEAQKHLFDKFYQEDASHKEEGNGLGLALVKRILTIEGGEIVAENLSGGGCRFTVVLPGIR